MPRRSVIGLAGLAVGLVLAIACAACVYCVVVPGRPRSVAKFAGAVELGDADVDDGIIDQGLLLIRKLWDAGLAHRDIKPGNLMVRDSELLLIDAGFAQVRPSPWRQAVDLGNMMLVLAVRTDTERVYRRVLGYFTPDELAEAFAATRGAASPTQLRAFMKRDPRDLLGEFRALAPPRRPIVLQRWGTRRVRHLPVQLRPRRGPRAGDPGGHRGRVRAESRPGRLRATDRGPGALRSGSGVLGPRTVVSVASHSREA
jgi:hypothetical protein